MMPISLFDRPALTPIPQAFSVRQKLSIHALIFSIEAVELSYNRLVDGLSESGKGLHQNDQKFSCEMLLNAWTIVDNSHRFYKVISQIPGNRNVVNTSHSRFDVFRDNETFRHYYAHMEALPAGMRDTQSFGGLTWFDREIGQMPSLLYGVVGKNPIQMMTIPQSVTLPIGAITLTTGPNTINISNLTGSFAGIVGDLTKGLENFRPNVRPTS